VTKPSDDVAAWAEGQRVAARTAESSARGNSIATAHDKLEQTDGALAAISSLIEQTKSLAVQAANGTLSATDRANMAQAITGIRAQVLAQANVQASDGEYLLAGSKGGAAPFDAAGNYLGDTNQRSIETAQGGFSTVAVTGTIINSSTGVNVLTVLDSFATALASNNVAGIQNSIPDLTKAVQQVANGRQNVGDSIAALQVSDDARSSFELELSARHAKLIDLDPVQGATTLANAKNVLDTAAAVAAQVVEMVKPNR
jgi:flagellar hook-associated protein 3 FlgL